MLHLSFRRPRTPIYARLATLFSFCAVAPGIHAQEPAALDGELSRTEEVLASEDVIENLRAQMAVLSESAANLRVPDHRARTVFQSVVRVRGLAPEPGEPRADSLGLDLEQRDWPVASVERKVELDDLALLQPFFDGVDFFHHVKFYTRKGHFDGSERGRYHAESGFKGMAQLAGGELGYANASLDITWEGDPATLGVGWRIARVELVDFSLTSAERPFFTDVLDGALDPAARGAARRSVRDEALVELVNGVRSGELVLEDLLEQRSEPGAATQDLVMSHVCVLDVDRDGLDDFYVCPSDAKAQFFRNRGGGRFDEIADELGLGLDRVQAATFADFDNDGDADVFVSFAPSSTHFFRNEGGRFVDRTDLTEGGFPELAYAISPMDYDGDGLVDVYFSRYNGSWIGTEALRLERARAASEDVAPSFLGMEEEESRVLAELLYAEGMDPFVSRPGPPNRLFRNLGDGRFEHAAGAAAAEQYTQSLAATWSDFDLDGDMDLYVVTEAAPNQLIRNDGDGTFTDVTDEATADVGFGMGLGIGDYDRDGRQDVYVTNMYSKAGLRISEQMDANELIRGAARGNSLLRNGEDGWSRVSGVEEPAILVEAADFGWGGAFADFNNDGVLDLYAPAGFVTMPKAVEGVGET